jgi:hypothetical protein
MLFRATGQALNKGFSIKAREEFSPGFAASTQRWGSHFLLSAGERSSDAGNSQTLGLPDLRANP